MWFRGFGANESKAAFIRARELAEAIDNPTERFTIYYGLFVGNMARGEWGFAPQASPHFSGVSSNKRIKRAENLSEKNRNPPIDGEDRHERPERIEYWLTV